MKYSVFNRDDIYDLVSAQHSALELEKESKIGSGWYDFANEEAYREEFEILGEYREEFEEDLVKAAEEVEGYFEELLNLDELDFETSEEFFCERQEIQEIIIDKALLILEKYCTQ